MRQWGNMVKFGRMPVHTVAMVALVAGGTSVIGIALLARSGAATYSQAGEAESGNLAGVYSKVSDGAASGGQSVKFGVGTGSSGGAGYGTLMTLPEHAAEEASSGMKLAMLELAWDQYEPQDGQFNAAYAAAVKQRLQTLKASGMKVTLAMGVHYAPGWVANLSGGRYVNQTGATSSQPNVVFSSSVRAAVKQYYDRIDQDLDITNFSDIRLTSGGNAEMLYPDNNFWAFDANAQNGPGMPASMARNPLPGWKPGDRTVSTSQVQQWADWYVKALADVAYWQMTVFRAQGFSGTFQMLTPGSGVRPSGYNSDVANYLPVPSVTGVGAVWHKFYEFLPDKSNVMVYVSSVADHSGNDDTCTAGDAGVALTNSTANSWSAVRWGARIAKEYGLPVGGENPGYNAPASFNDWYRDQSATGMMATALAQAKTCGLKSFYWAHDDKLWDGTLPFALYAQRVAAQ
jgi:hypothetical protein